MVLGRRDRVDAESMSDGRGGPASFRPAFAARGFSVSVSWRRARRTRRDGAPFSLEVRERDAYEHRAENEPREHEEAEADPDLVDEGLDE